MAATSFEVVRRFLPMLVWLFFLARGAFYCVALPTWEGWDEWSHFAFVQHLENTGRLPAPAVDRPSREILASLEAGPVAWGIKGMIPALLSYEEYWALAVDERQALELRQGSIPEAWRLQQSDLEPIWEAQQPPLYYWLMQPVLWAARDQPLATRVLFLRMATLLLASLMIPLGYLALSELLASRGAALALTACVCAMPGLMLDVCRVGNEAPVVVLYTLLLLCGLRLVRAPEDLRWWLAAGAAIGCGLLSKAYFLTAFAPLGVLAGWLAWNGRRQWRRILGGWAAAMLIPALAAGWWYRFIWEATGTATGQIQTVAIRHLGLAGKLAVLPQMNWRQALDTVVLSHVWMGGWSFLQVRAWIYHLCGMLIVTGVAGALLLMLRPELPKPEVREPRRLAAASGLLVAPFLAAMGYQAVAAYLTIGQPVSNGWYLYAVIFAEAALVYAGVATLTPRRGRRWIVPAATLGAIALDIYGMLFWLLPYYHGLIRHLPDGKMQNFHLEQAQRMGGEELLVRLAVNRPYFDGAEGFLALAALWAAATLALPAIAWMSARKGGES
ncbi:MAG: phospholipid carrier-dependent glycosyltransferase [Acidobacteria bacterium]|nr:phospholipid carrier-dependent glycosyltransferase [Acidobacteriota bacterium]